ncbi:MAG: YdcF family protein [Planctomycetia bacterium]|nr:YdcF family protein [Planctomycetia bacterium]
MWFPSSLLFVCLLTLCWWGRHERASAWWRVAFVVCLAALVGVVWWFPAPIILQKLANRIVMPCGVIWFGILFVIAYAVRQNQFRTATALGAVQLLFTLLGNDYLAHRLAGRIEAPFAAILPLETGHYDAVFVLGGSTGTTPAGAAQLDWSGDRVMLAARMFHQGQVDYLITTGERIDGLHTIGRDPSQETSEIWKTLGIPEEKILLLDGRNTREEMQGIQKMMQEHQWKRLGVITSAQHMPRAVRLAETNGVKLEPLPANFEGGETPWTELSLIPDSASMYTNHKSLKELLANLIGA